jgi:hypothetical protein
LVEPIEVQGIKCALNESFFRVRERTSIDRNDRGPLCEALAIAQVAMQVAAHFALGERHQSRRGNSCPLEDALIDRFVVEGAVHSLSRASDRIRGECERAKSARYTRPQGLQTRIALLFLQRKSRPEAANLSMHPGY